MSATRKLNKTQRAALEALARASQAVDGSLFNAMPLFSLHVPCKMHARTMVALDERGLIDIEIVTSFVRNCNGPTDRTMQETGGRLTPAGAEAVLVLRADLETGE